MPHPLLDVDHLTDEVELYLRSVGDVFSAFRRQDSGCHSIGVALGDERWFVKFSVADRAISSLERAIALHREVTHPVVISLRHVLRVPSGLALVYPWVDGEVLYGAPVAGRAQRLDPEGAHARFRSLGTDEILSALDAIFDAHLTIAAPAGAVRARAGPAARFSAVHGSGGVPSRSHHRPAHHRIQPRAQRSGAARQG